MGSFFLSGKKLMGFASLHDKNSNEEFVMCDKYACIDCSRCKGIHLSQICIYVA